jgi:Secretion system C-terminal sorting domain
MKKITLLFAILLVMSGIAFGQSASKLLWETKISSINKLDYLSISTGSKFGDESTFISDNTNRYAIDKDGNIIWKFPSIQIIGINNFWASKSDTLYRIDKDLKFTNSPKLPKIPNAGDFYGPDEVEDGYIIRNIKTNEIIKWDYEVKEIWKYKLTNGIKLKDASFRQTTLGYSFDYSFSGKGKDTSQVFSLKLDKQGKQTYLVNKKIIPTYQLGTSPTPTADKGMWLHESPFGGIGVSIMVRLDSTNKEIFMLETFNLPKIINRTDAFPIFKSVSGYYDLPLGVTPNGSLIYGFYTVDGDKKPKSLFFAKIDGISKPILTDEIDMKGKSIESLPSSIRVIDDDNFIFSSPNSFNVVNKGGIGAANFKAKNSIWANRVDIEYGLTNSFGNFMIAMDNSLPILRNDSLICYSIDGKIKWIKANVKQFNYFDQVNFGINSTSYLYAVKDGLTTKIRISDGKELWTLKLKPSKIVSEDLEGNTYLYQEDVMYSPSFSRRYSVDFISKTGKTASIYNSLNVDFNQLGVPGFSSYGDYGRYQIDGKNKFFYANSLEKQIDGTFQFIYRKYSTRCAYDLEATAEATGKTEVCSGTKVKLSTTKQDGQTYQWQKDGKDILNFKDIVHDVEESGNYTVTVKDEICQNQTTSNPVKVIISPTPESIITTDTKGIVYEPFTVKMSANTGTGLSYQWLKDDVIIPSETTANYEAKKSGKYNVSVSKEGCAKLSDALTITILIPLANQEEVGEEVVQVYPNPSKGEFKIILPKSLKSADIQLFDAFGRERTLMYVGEQAQAEGLVQGVYFLRVQKGEKSVTSKLIIE